MQHLIRKNGFQFCGIIRIADGTLDKLIKENITDLGGADPVATDIPVIDGAETLKVAVTGDMPALDVILPDGKPAGFNVAFLSELSKRINKNFELVSIEAGARGAALSSGQVDVLFWVLGSALSSRQHERRCNLHSLHDGQPRWCDVEIILAINI